MVLAAVTVVGAVVFTTRGSWGGWMLFGMAVVLVVAAVLDIREKRRGGRRAGDARGIGPRHRLGCAGPNGGGSWH
ncbi:hypothetical protein [Kocuria sp. CNJ-770]|uniref:hypothetical protein n=1 Tax=Kocuria sp. CNJ-770 TaxID=1904964 RepID=UPI0011152AFF|nr:hypothetical protein [Kocuria sp. CNJ-770]